MNEMREGALFSSWHSSVSEYGGCLCSHPTAVLALCIRDLNKEGNASAGREQVVDHSEQCRSRMELILVTTTEGHERLERARDRFAQAAK